MKTLTIQARLALWYCISGAAIVALFAGASWFAMRATMYHAIDRDLRYRLASVAPFVANRGLNTREQLEGVLAGSSDSAIVGVFVQITGDGDGVLYESDVLRTHHLPVLADGRADGAVGLQTAGGRKWPVRVASTHLVVGGVGLTVHVVEPLRDTMESLEEYRNYLLVLLPIALLLTTSAGYWMSRRALAPVEQIRREAEAIDPADLAARLRVPATDDELARLARTLNAMLTRIEGGFRAVEQFTADASHELRAPLALIQTAGEVSLRKERTREELAEVLRKVVREARHMSKLVESLLELARGDARERRADLGAVDLAGLVRELCAELQPAAQEKGLALGVEVEEGDFTALGDATELRRLVLILLDNAIKYTEAGRVDVAVQRVDDGFALTVADTGIGIEASALPHVFDRFWRADKVRSRAEGGVGLGLALAAQIVKRHGGKISVESGPGAGARFVVLLWAAE